MKKPYHNLIKDISKAISLGFAEMTIWKEFLNVENEKHNLKPDHLNNLLKRYLKAKGQK